MSCPINVVIADDSAFMRKKIREILESDPDIRVVGGGSRRPGGRGLRQRTRAARRDHGHQYAGHGWHHRTADDHGRVAPARVDAQFADPRGGAHHFRVHGTGGFRLRWQALGHHFTRYRPPGRGDYRQGQGGNALPNQAAVQQKSNPVAGKAVFPRPTIGRGQRSHRAPRGGDWRIDGRAEDTPGNRALSARRVGGRGRGRPAHAGIVHRAVRETLERCVPDPLQGGRGRGYPPGRAWLSGAAESTCYSPNAPAEASWPATAPNRATPCTFPRSMS